MEHFSIKVNKLVEEALDLRVLDRKIDVAISYWINLLKNITNKKGVYFNPR